MNMVYGKNEILKKTFIQFSCFGVRLHYDMVINVYDRCCRWMIRSEKTPTVEDFTAQLYDCKSSSFDKHQLYALKQEFYLQVNKYCAHYNQEEILSASKFIQSQIRNNALFASQYNGGIDSLPHIHGLLGFKFFSFITNSYLRDMMILMTQIKDFKGCEIVIHICYLALHDMEFLISDNKYKCDNDTNNQNDHKYDEFNVDRNLVKTMFKQFFIGISKNPFFTKKDQTCLLKVICDMNLSNYCDSTKILHQRLLQVFVF